MKRNILFSGFLVALLILLNGSAVSAQDDSDWQFNLAPFYLWAVNIEGEGTVGNNTNEISVEFEDIFDNLESVFIVHFEGMHKSGWGFLIDTNYLDISGDQGFPTGNSLNVDFQATLAEFSGLYRIKQQKHVFDFIAGVRYTKMEVDLNMAASPPLALNATQDWIDPLIGARWVWQFADKWSLGVRGDIGGFGVGSDFAWQAAALVDWQPFEYVSFIAGYRALDMDYEDEDNPNLFKMDATFHGPVLGLNFRW